MKKLFWKVVPWWLPLMAFGGKSVQAEDFVKFLPSAELGAGINTDSVLVTNGTVTLAEFDKLVQVRFGVEAAINRTAVCAGPSIKLKELVERLGGEYKLDKNIALTVAYSVDPLNIPVGKTLLDTGKFSITATIFAFKL